MTMHSTQSMERISTAYVEALAASVGFQIGKPPVDDDSIDGIIISKKGRRPRIEFQLKSTGAYEIKDGKIAFNLSVKNYNDLKVDAIIPRILILLIMPEIESEWVQHSENELAIRKCAYWLNIAGFPDTDNQATKSVDIPSTNVFSPETLRSLMEKAGQGEVL